MTCPFSYLLTQATFGRTRSFSCSTSSGDRNSWLACHRIISALMVSSGATPVYNWDALRQTGYRWCIDRIRALLAHVDVIRLDHFRGFAAAWHVPAGATTAQTGQWVPGPGADFFNALKRELGVLPFIAEDLGLITPDASTPAMRSRYRGPECCSLP